MSASLSLRVLSAVAAAVAALGLVVACDSDSPDEVPTESPAQEEEEQEAPESSDQEDEEEEISEEEELDLSTREGVDRAYEAQVGNSLGKRTCYGWPESFPEIVVIGDGVYDYGCMFRGVFVDGKWVRGFEDATKSGLAARRWGELGADEREELARFWVEEVAFSFDYSVIRDSTDAFELSDTPDFEPSVARTKADGTTVVVLWVREPPGRLAERAFRRYEYRFDDEAKVQREQLERFAVPLDRLRDE